MSMAPMGEKRINPTPHQLHHSLLISPRPIDLLASSSALRTYTKACEKMVFSDSGGRESGCTCERMVTR